jgi:tRNA (mo5U34)-methyltransferase
MEIGESTQERADDGNPASPEELVASNRRWYHTMELGNGLVTPGWFDLRKIVDKLPWPEVAGKRCLDVGPYDGFLAFEMERRGAREVIAADIGDWSGWDWPLRMRGLGPANMERAAEPDPGAGFKLAKRLLGSSVERIVLSVYDLDPERVGTFDVITCGSLLLHLRDPVRALEAMRSVCDEHLLSAEQIDPVLTALRPRTPSGRFRAGVRCQWWVPNAAGHRALVSSAGFRIVKRTRLGRAGVPHAALLATPEPIESTGR